MVQVAPARLTGGRAQPFIAALIGILYWTAHTMVRPLIGPHVLSLGGTAGDASLVLASFAIVPTLLAIPIGSFTDRFGAKPMLIWGSVLMVLGGGVLVAPVGIPGLVVSQIVIGVGTLMVWVSLQTAITHPIDENETAATRNSRLATFSLFLATGQAIGPFLGGFVADTAGITWSFAVFVLLSLILCGLGLIMRPSPVHRPEYTMRPAASALRSYRAALGLMRRPVVLVTVLVSFMALVGLDLRNAYFPLLLAPQGLSTLQVGALLTIAAIAGFASRPVFVPAMRSIPPAVMVAAVLGLSALSGVSVVFVGGNFPLLVALSILNGFALGFAQPMTLSLMADFTAPSERGLASGLRSTANRAAQFANPALLGVVGAAFGLAAGFLTVGALTIVVTGVCVALFARRGPSRFGHTPRDEG